MSCNDGSLQVQSRNDSQQHLWMDPLLPPWGNLTWPFQHIYAHSIQITTCERWHLVKHQQANKTITQGDAAAVASRAAPPELDNLLCEEDVRGYNVANLHGFVELTEFSAIKSHHVFIKFKAESWTSTRNKSWRHMIKCTFGTGTWRNTGQSPIFQTERKGLTHKPDLQSILIYDLNRKHVSSCLQKLTLKWNSLGSASNLTGIMN